MKNGSPVICNTERGKVVFEKERANVWPWLNFDDALRFKALKKHIELNEDRELFMQDLQSGISFSVLNKKWAKRPTLKLLINKYIWGNRQKVFFHELFRRKK